MVVLSEIRALLETEELGAHLTVVDGQSIGAHGAISYDRGWLTEPPAGVDAADVLADARSLIDNEQNRTVEYADASVFIEVLAPPPSLIIFGAVHAAQALAKLAMELGYRVTVVDARSAFLSEARFPPPLRCLHGWPGDVAEHLVFDRRTFVVLLSHDARFEDPVWPLVADTDVKYLGAMGSRRTHEKRVDKLQQAGWDQAKIDRIHGPVGLDLGAETPEEMAVSILAEMTQVRYGSGSGLSLRGRAGRIHRQRTED